MIGDFRVYPSHRDSGPIRQRDIRVEKLQFVRETQIDLPQLKFRSRLECDVFLQSIPEPALRINVEPLDFLGRPQCQRYLSIRVRHTLRAGFVRKSVNATTVAPAIGDWSAEDRT